LMAVVLLFTIIGTAAHAQPLAGEEAAEIASPPSDVTLEMLRRTGATVTIGEYLELLERELLNVAVRLKEWLTAIMVRDNIPPMSFGDRESVWQNHRLYWMAELESPAPGMVGPSRGRVFFFEWRV
ncbi:hypothetical protein M1O24_00995, partial [Dehalococcoidia bacterium]|nr:hypothetical protein [Dehalococcoidia bacterium]